MFVTALTNRDYIDRFKNTYKCCRTLVVNFRCMYTVGTSSVGRASDRWAEGRGLTSLHLSSLTELQSSEMLQIELAFPWCSVRDKEFKRQLTLLKLPDNS